MIINNKIIDVDDYLADKEEQEESIESTSYFVEQRHDFDAIMEFAKQKGFVTTCDDCSESFHFHNVDSVNEIVDQAVSEGLFEFYEHDGTCYRLTEKGVQKFPHDFQGEQ